MNADQAMRELQTKLKQAEGELEAKLEQIARLSDSDRELLNQALLLRMAREETLETLAKFTRRSTASLAWQETRQLLGRFKLPRARP